MEEEDKAKKAYELIVSDRPLKFSGEDVDYREGQATDRCGHCLHMYERVLDEYGVCEVVRLEDESSIERDHVCDYFTRDGLTFPLLK